MRETTFEKELSVVARFNLRDNFFVIGVDEAGRGPLAGPVVACAAVLKDLKNTIQLLPPCLEDSALPLGPGERKNNYWDLVRDSKTLSEKQREKVFDFIHQYFYIGVGIVNSKTIDRINILQASFLAMKVAIQELRQNLKLPARRISQLAEKGRETACPPVPGFGRRGNLEEDSIYLLVDGNQTIPNISIKQEAIVNGDGSVKSIAAASIIAKVTRDRIMKDFNHKYPAYGFAKHKGYGTRSHIDALRRFGPCPIHRMSFRPVLLSIPENVNKRFNNVLKPKKR